MTIEKLAEYRKAIAAFLVPALIVLGASLTGDSAGGSAVTASEWVTIVIAALGTGGVVVSVENAITTRQIRKIENAGGVVPPLV